MPISKETLKAMIRDFQGFDLSDEELDLVRPELDSYEAALEQLRDLDLSGLMSSRLLRVEEGRESNGGG